MINLLLAEVIAGATAKAMLRSDLEAHEIWELSAALKWSCEWLLSVRESL
jgi:hypothetical protein